MSLAEATKIEEGMNETLLATIEEMISAKIHYGNDEFSEAAACLQTALSNLIELSSEMEKLEREVQG